MQYVSEQKTQPDQQMVVSMSLDSPACQALDAAVDSLYANGIPVVVAAGNDGADACTVSP
jgi:subtilisin family serine protease